MLSILENMAKYVDLHKTDYEGRLGVLEDKMKRINGKSSNMVNMSSHTIHTNVEGIKTLANHWKNV